MNEQDTAVRLRQIELRLSRIEQLLDLAPPSTALGRVQRETPVAAPALPVEPAILSPAAPVPDISISVARSAPPAPTEPHKPPAPRPAGTPLEVLIGERWMAWVGAVVVVVAVGFFVKLAYDLGWWARLTPSIKCLVAATFGFLLLAGGELALRKIGRAAAVSLFAAGLGTLYVTAYATFRFFDLLPQTGAFWLMAVVALLGFGVTLRGCLLAIGVLSLLGGYAAPLLLREQVTFTAALPLYLTGLLTVALGLSALRPTPFRPLRYVGMILLAAVATLWIVEEGTAHWLTAMVFMTAWWALMLAEALLAALRGQSPRGNPIAALLFTVWYVSAGCNVLSSAHPLQRNWLGLFAGVVAAICVCVALPFGPGLSVLKAQPRRAMERLVVTLWALVGVLVATAFALQFRDPGESFGQSIGWLAMAVASIEVGRRLPSTGVTVFGLLLLALALGRVWTIDHQLFTLTPIVWVYGDVCITRWALLALGAIGATQFAARRLRAAGGFPWEKLAAVLTFLSAIQWMIVCVDACRELALTTGWLAGAVALAALAPYGHSPGYRRTAMLVLFLAIAKWLLVDALGPRLQGGWSPLAALPLLNWQMAVALLACGCTVWLYHTHPALRRKARFEAQGVGLAPTVGELSRAANVLTVGILFLVAALSFEVDRVLGRLDAAHPPDMHAVWQPLQARALWCALLWTAAGLASVVAGSRRRLPSVVWTGVFLMLCGAGIWLGFGTLYWRIEHGPTLCQPVLNAQFFIGVALAALAAATARTISRWSETEPDWEPAFRHAAALGHVLVALLGLWLGSFELDRWFAPEAHRVGNAAMARQTALSVYWGLYALALIALGFWRRSSFARYAGLALLGLTLAKVMLVDLAQVRYFYRVLSLLVIGLLFIVTALAYARLASALRVAPQSADRPPGSETR